MERQQGTRDHQQEHDQARLPAAEGGADTERMAAAAGRAAEDGVRRVWREALACAFPSPDDYVKVRCWALCFACACVCGGREHKFHSLKFVVVNFRGRSLALCSSFSQLQ